MTPSQEPAQPQHPGPPPVDQAPGAVHSAGAYGLVPSPGPEPYWLAGSDYPAARARRSARRPWRRTAAAAVASGSVIFLLGAPLGLLWHWLAPAVPVVDTVNGVVVNDPSPEEYIAADAWFTLLGLGFGLLGSVAAWLVVRRDRGPFLLLGVVIGMLGAGYLVAPWVGETVGRAGYRHWREIAVPGATYQAPPELHSVGPMLVPAFVAAIVLTLLAGWSNDPDLDEPGAQPGYGPNRAAAYPADEMHGPVEPPRG